MWVSMEMGASLLLDAPAADRTDGHDDDHGHYDVAKAVDRGRLPAERGGGEWVFVQIDRPRNAVRAPPRDIRAPAPGGWRSGARDRGARSEERRVGKEGRCRGWAHR